MTGLTSEAHTNGLKHETSPYLLQHAGNPVDWQPWGEAALRRARDEDKPILLSIGYSACHWCHVMAHESFEDPDVAVVMNERFVNIKVDREERPDLDQIYQSAHQMLSQRSGGWPLTVFLTPQQVPFFAGTYFPKTARYNLPGFADLCRRIADIFRERRAEIQAQTHALLEGLAGMAPPAGEHQPEITAAPIAAALRSLKGSFDSRHGGFGAAPKFPHTPELAFCLRNFAATGDEDALRMATLTLERMCDGGIYDHLGGGFCRYSVDGSWTIPHFEKMLYDNGPLLGLLADAWCSTRNPLFAGAARETAAWAMREMQSVEGGYYSSLDADSEGVEGKYYVWTPGRVEALLGADEYAVLAPHYGLDGGANFEAAHWHLHVSRPLAAVAARIGKPVAQCEALLASARGKLFAARQDRLRPGRDDKILSSWNALMIAGMARAASVFARADWLDSARRALDFVRGTMWRNESLLATYRDGRAHLNAYLDDYAFLILACIEMLQAKFDRQVLGFAEDLAEALLERFEDAGCGGFFFTSHDHEKLIHRPKPGFDNATPSGNGIAAFALQRLALLTGELRYGQAARRALAFFWPAISEHPGAHASLLAALAETLEPTRSVILRGPEPALSNWREALACELMPDTLVVAIPMATGTDQTALPPLLNKQMTVTTGAETGTQVNAWVCQGVTCMLPVDTLEGVRALLARPAQVAVSLADKSR